MNKIEEFKEEIIKLYKKYNLSLSHEDTHGGFEIEELSEHNVNWLKEARGLDNV